MTRNWSTHSDNRITFLQQVLSHLSVRVRSQQFALFSKLTKLTPNKRVLDVGSRADETLPDSNLFEKLFPYPEKLTVASVENCRALFKKRYPKVKFIQVRPDVRLPFRRNHFDIATSWATLEHVGTSQQQQYFLEELCRISKKVFLTTPNKNWIYEPHTSFFFIHLLPRSIFLFFCRIFGKKFWSKIENLNPLSKADLKKITSKIKTRKLKIKTYYMFGFIPSHLIIYC